MIQGVHLVLDGRVLWFYTRSRQIAASAHNPLLNSVGQIQSASAFQTTLRLLYMSFGDWHGINAQFSGESILSNLRGSWPKTRVCDTNISTVSLFVHVVYFSISQITIACFLSPF